MQDTDAEQQDRLSEPVGPASKPVPVSRRRFVGAGAVALGAGGLGAIGLGAAQFGRPSSIVAQDAGTPAVGTPIVDADFVEPPVLASKDGFLAIKLEAKPDPNSGPGRFAYEAQVPGPTIKIKPGDNLKVALVNNLGTGEETNLHVHGFHVSPSGNSDNIFVHAMSGQTFNYNYDVPANHAPGIYWYHPHHHGMANAQVSAGMAGIIIVEGGLDEVPGVAGLPDKIMAMQGPFTGPDGNPQYLVNGRVNPVISIAPGETQRWRLANISANEFFNLQLAGHSLHQIAADGNPLPGVVTTNTVLLGPGERAEVLVQGGPAGIYEFRSLEWSPDIPSQTQPAFLVATVISAGAAVEPAELPTTLIPFDDLNNDVIAQQRTIVFQETPFFGIDGVQFVPGRVDQTVKLGTTEEWTIQNSSPEWHPFHIHVNDFQVMSRNGEEISPHYEDTTLLPPNGEVVIRMRFLDFTGKFVYHCHILVHEDAGMMGVVEVVE